MRIATAALVLVLLAGTQARHFWQHDEPQQTALERFHNTLNLYVETFKTGVSEAVAQIDSSTFGQKLDLKLAEGVNTLSGVVDKIREEVSPQLDAVRAQFDADLEKLRQELTKDLTSVQPFIENFQKNVQKDLEGFWGNLQPIAQELRDITQANLESLQQKVQPVAENTRDKVRGHVDELRKSIAPYGEEVRQKLSETFQELSEKKFPEWSQYQAQAQQHLATAQEKFAALAEKVKVELGPTLESVKARFVEFLTTVQKNLEQQLKQS